MRLFWHQRDLRLQDNVGLAAAARNDDVVPVYVYDTDLLATVGKRQRAFFLRGVSRLREAYREAASGAIQAAYDEYTERLESMGVNPKPVC